MEWGENPVLKKYFELLHDKPSIRKTKSTEQGV
jgi:hypothetical protein